MKPASPKVDKSFVERNRSWGAQDNGTCKSKPIAEYMNNGGVAMPPPVTFQFDFKKSK